MTQERKIITRAEFDKKVDVEYAHYTHIDRMGKDEARQKALEEVSKQYQVG